MQRDSSGEVSFDPKTWVSASPDAPAAPDPRRTAPPPPPPPSASSAGPLPPFALAIGASALLLVGGGAAAYLTGSKKPLAPVAASAAAGTPADTADPAAPINASRRTLVVASADQIGPTLTSSGVAADVARSVADATAQALGKAAGDVRLVIDLVGPDNGRRPTRVEATRDDGAGVVLVAKVDGGFAPTVLQAKLTTKVKVVRGEMDATSFYNAAVTAGITDSVVSDFANAFSYDFDFQREVKPGDIFEAAFEQQYNPAGEAVGAPTLVYVSLQTAEKSKALYRFLAPGDTEPGWYDGNGHSTVKALMRTPVDGARISSQFGYRVHPVLGFMKLHKGTDFAAPIGTPIYASGNAVVKWAAMKGPNGNLTILQHDNGWQTYYLHQSMFMPGVTPGARVSQGQKIGEIGTTGRSTGPHLHYEVHINGEAVDSTKIDTGTGKSLDGASLAAFKKERDRIDVSRANPTP